MRGGTDWACAARQAWYAEYLKDVSKQRERGEGRNADADVVAAIAGLPRGRWLLAVSGGRDSMVLLHAMAAHRAADVAAVATFDHGTGVHARQAAALVVREARRRGMPVMSGVADRGLPFSEAAWRTARHRFLDTWSAELDATVITAHTRDDEIETVVGRLLRDAGPRGLAGMRANAPIGALAGGAVARGSQRVRPLLEVPRASVAAYARAHDIIFVADPSNADPRFQRNRIRHEILPALEQASPGFGEWCWSLGARAAEWRARMDDLVLDLGVQLVAPGSVVLPAEPFLRCEAPEWSVLWPAICARAGVVMDRRGIARASEWAPRATKGQSIPLSGDARIDRTASTFVVHGPPPGTTPPSADYILEQ